MFVKGQSGNPKGRAKKGQCLTDILEKFGNKKDVQKGDVSITRREALAEKVWELAIKGDFPAIKYIYDRIDGQPVQKTENINLPTVLEYGVPDENSADTENRDTSEGADSLQGS